MEYFKVVPKSMDKLFSQFPRTLYGPIEPLDRTEEENLLNRKIYLQSKHNQSSLEAEYFTLGTYGLFEYRTTKKNSKVLLSTDPFCLFAQLSLCKKNDFELPKIRYKVMTSNETDVSLQELKSSIMILSYHAASDNELPILIENDTNVHNKRIIRSNFQINELNLLTINNNEDYLIIELIDKVFYDIWIYSIVAELSNSQILAVYNSRQVLPEEDSNEELSDNFLVNSLTFDLLVHLLKRNEFHNRYPNIYQKYCSYWPTIFTNKVNQEINDIYGEFVELLQLLHSKRDAISPVIVLKLSSYVLCIKRFLSGSKLYDLIQQYYPRLFDIAESTMNDC